MKRKYLKIEVKKMKELYQNAEMDVVKFSAEDVIATSVEKCPGGQEDVLPEIDF